MDDTKVRELGLIPFAKGQRKSHCDWFFLCSNEAIGERRYLTGTVPCCERCAKIASKS